MSISINNLEVAYDKQTIIKNLSINIPKNKITVIIGENGCGKSTFLKTIGRIIQPKSGDIYVNDKNIKKIKTKDIAKFLAYLPQSPANIVGLKVKDLVAYGRFPHQKPLSNLSKNDLECINEAMKDTGILDLADKSIDELSGGQRQRAFIALCLAQKTDILLLDEPTTYLDIAHQLEILKLLNNLNKKRRTTIIMVLHEINHASKFADYIIGMKKGEIIFKGAPIDVINTTNLKELYNINANMFEHSKHNSTYNDITSTSTLSTQNDIISNTHKPYPILIDYDLD